MAVAHRDSQHIAWASRTNTTVTAPTGIQNGDLLVIIFCIYGATSTQTASPPNNFNVASGFPHAVTNPVGSDSVNNYCWYKVASGESGNYTITNSVNITMAWIAAYSGADAVAPLNPAPTFQLGRGGTSTAPGVTTADADTMIVFWDQDWGDKTNALTAPTGTTPTFAARLNVANTETSVLYVADGVVANASTATGDKTQTNNSSSTGAGNPWGAGLVAIVPATSTPKTLADVGSAADMSGAQAATTSGPYYASSAAGLTGGTGTWANPTNVYADDGAVASWTAP